MRFLAFALCFCAVVGCGRINETYKREVDGKVAALQASSTTYPAQDGSPMPLAVGQWVDYKLTGSNKRPGFVSYKVVGQQGSAFWVETILTTYQGKQETRMLVDFGNRTDPATFRVHSVVMRSNGKLLDYTPATMQLMQALWKPVMSSFALDWSASAPREAARAGAGDFAGCYRRRLTLNVGPYQQLTDAWLHPAVPINGIVRSASVGKNPSITELIAFGTDGAKSSFQ
jgi:hypothetical protein